MLRKLIPLLLFLALTVLLVVGLQNADTKSIIDSPLIGKPTPDFALTDMHSGAVITPDTLRGQAYLLNVWASWCPECQVEHSVITAIADTDEIPVVGLNYKDADANARRWLSQFGNPYDLILVDLDGRVAIEFGVYGAPETFLVDAGGIIRFKQTGALHRDVWENQIRPLLASQPSEQ